MPLSKNESADARLIEREAELVHEAMVEIVNKKEVITPKKVASIVRKKERSNRYSCSPSW